MSDLIRIVDLEVWTRIGVLDKERAKPQLLLVSLAMVVKGVEASARGDNLALTIDYSDVAEQVKNFGTRKPRRLIETFATELADDLLAAFPMLSVRIEVKKFILTDARHVSIEIERKRRES
jgi:FolB domain-containing protein